ncbi:hypothetical protein K438DRAFT_1749661 [Mycena galopus ATCC 62051]|nr:hypothetical protein K438DRAFT_1749661 [Mycena galopus ATCC 62051]
MSHRNNGPILGRDTSAPTPSEVAAGIAVRPGAAEVADQISANLARRIAAMSIEPPPVYDALSYGALNSHAHARTSPHPLIDGISQDGEGVERCWAGNTNTRRMPPMLERATAVLNATPGAELIFSRSALELLGLLEDDNTDDDMPPLET